MAFQSLNAINRRNWNLLIEQAVAPAPPPPSFPGVLYYGIANDTAQVPRGDPLAEQTAMLSTLATYGVATFELVPLGVVNNVPVDLEGLVDGETMTITGTAANPNQIVVVGVPDFGRYNTTDGGARYVQYTVASGVTKFTFTPSVATFNSFGLYMTDPGDFPPGDYTFTVNTNMGVYTPGFSLLPLIPTANGCLVFWGFTLPSGYTVTSVELTGTIQSDIVGFDDVIFGNFV